MTVRSAWLLENGQTRADTRLAPLGAMTPVDALTSRQGIVPGGTAFAANGVSAMQLQIAPGRALVQGSVLQGAYPVVLAEAETLTFADGDAQFGRIDVVVLRVKDTVYDATGEISADIEILQGAHTATPQPPLIPASALPLYQVAVDARASAGTGGITWSSALEDLREYTVAVGGILPEGTDNPAGGHVGQVRIIANRLHQWTGNSWQEFAPPSVLGSAGAWYEYTPAWRATNTSAVSIGNGKIKMRWTRVGRTVFGTLRMHLGSTTAVGTAANGWFWELPVTPLAVAGIPSYGVGIATAFRGGVSAYSGAVQADPVANEMYILKNDSGFVWGNHDGHPFPTTPRAGDMITATFLYEAAA
jgi:hypothetical protein